MRDPKRIDDFCLELATIWKENCPDWRFGQFISNVLGAMEKDIFFPEENEMLNHIRNYFNKQEVTHIYQKINEPSDIEIKFDNEKG